MSNLWDANELPLEDIKEAWRLLNEAPEILSQDKFEANLEVLQRTWQLLPLTEEELLNIWCLHDGC